MRKRNPIGSVLGWLFEPIRRNPNFFVFMYLLGVISAVCTLPRCPAMASCIIIFLSSFSLTFIWYAWCWP